MKIYTNVPELKMITPFDKYIGTEYWFKATLTCLYFDKVNYVKLKERTQDYVEFDAIPANCIEYTNYNRAHIPSFYRLSAGCKIMQIHKWKPWEVLSDSEVQEILDRNDEIYRHSDMHWENEE